MNSDTKDQIAAVMLGHGTPLQQREALCYALGVPKELSLKQQVALQIFTAMVASGNSTSYSDINIAVEAAEEFLRITK